MKFGIYVQRAFQNTCEENLKPRMMKGPNAPLPCVDDLESKVRPFSWNNIPVPVTEAFDEVIKVFNEFKSLIFENYNMTVETQRVVNMNQK